jgi:hypothetical protein
LAARRSRGRSRRARSSRPCRWSDSLNSASLDTYVHRLRAFRQGLKEAGYVEGENVAIEYRWAENKLDRLPALASRTGSAAGFGDQRFRRDRCIR